MSEKSKSIVVIPDHTLRDAIIAGVVGLIVLGFIVYGVMSMAGQSERSRANTIQGTILSKQFTPEPEQLITYGRKGLKSKSSDGEYLLKVKVDQEGGREFDVPVNKSTYEMKEVGDSLTFLRPPSER